MVGSGSQILSQEAGRRFGIQNHQFLKSRRPGPGDNKKCFAQRKTVDRNNRPNSLYISNQMRGQLLVVFWIVPVFYFQDILNEILQCGLIHREITIAQNKPHHKGPRQKNAPIS